MNKKTLLFISFLAIVSQVNAESYQYFCSSTLNDNKYGMTSNSIKDLQSILKLENKSTIGTSGFFGVQTKNQIILFQKKNKLTQTGGIGPATFKIIKDKYCSNKQDTKAQVASTTKSDTTFNFNSGIKVNDIIEVKNGYTLFEEEVPEFTTGATMTVVKQEIDPTKPKILSFDSTIVLAMGPRNDLFANWSSQNFDYCDVYVVDEGKFSEKKFIPTKRTQLATKLNSSGSFSTASNARTFIGVTKIQDYNQNIIAVQLECTNDKLKFIQRRTGFADLSY